LIVLGSGIRPKNRRPDPSFSPNHPQQRINVTAAFMVDKSNPLVAFNSLDVELRDAREELTVRRSRMTGILKRTCLAIVVLIIAFLTFPGLWKGMSIFYILAPARYVIYDLLRCISSTRFARRSVLELEGLRCELLKSNDISE